MTTKELRKLSRADLLELLLHSERELEQVKQQLAEVTEELHRKEIMISEAGSIADAAIALNGVFAKAQMAADQYLENVRMQCEQMEKEGREAADRMLAEAQERCRAMEEAAHDGAAE
ncbi:MAG: DNA repair protein [Lachnospiraceae bacterium]|nr:DNA repair protein [Lachnospiraceae bacterium]